MKLTVLGLSDKVVLEEAYAIQTREKMLPQMHFNFACTILYLGERMAVPLVERFDRKGFASSLANKVSTV